MTHEKLWRLAWLVIVALLMFDLALAARHWQRTHQVPYCSPGQHTAQYEVDGQMRTFCEVGR